MDFDRAADATIEAGVRRLRAARSGAAAAACTWPTTRPPASRPRSSTTTCGRRYNRGDTDVHNAMRQFARICRRRRKPCSPRVALVEARGANERKFRPRRSILPPRPAARRDDRSRRSTGASASSPAPAAQSSALTPTTRCTHSFATALEPIGCRLLQLRPCRYSLAKPATGRTMNSMSEWKQCAVVERDPERVSGAWVFRGTRTVPSRRCSRIWKVAPALTNSWNGSQACTWDQARGRSSLRLRPAVNQPGEFIKPAPALFESARTPGRACRRNNPRRPPSPRREWRREISPHPRAREGTAGLFCLSSGE